MKAIAGGWCYNCNSSDEECLCYIRAAEFDRSLEQHENDAAEESTRRMEAQQGY